MLTKLNAAMFCLALSSLAHAWDLAIPQQQCALSGLIGDGKSLDTSAIQRSIDTCAAQGGGTLSFPPGRYLSGPLFLKSGVRLFLDQDARLLASPERELYQASSQNQKYAATQGWLAFLNA